MIDHADREGVSGGIGITQVYRDHGIAVDISGSVATAEDGIHSEKWFMSPEELDEFKKELGRLEKKLDELWISIEKAFDKFSEEYEW